MTNCTRGLFSTLLCHNIGSRGLGEGEGDPGVGGGGRRTKGEGQSLAPEKVWYARYLA